MTTAGANSRLVRAFYDAIGGDVTDVFTGEDMMRMGELLAGNVTNDFECVMVAPFDEVRYQGLEGFAEAWRDWVEAYSSFVIDVDDVEERGDAVLMLVRQRGVTKRDDVAIEDAGAALWRFRDGKLCAAMFYLDRDSARRAFEAN